MSRIDRILLMKMYYVCLYHKLMFICRWWQAYREAQQFRFSHYFISYISEATCLLMGIGTIVPMATTTVSTAKSHVETSRNKNYSKHTPHRKDCKNNEEKVETEFSWCVFSILIKKFYSLMISYFAFFENVT